MQRKAAHRLRAAKARLTAVVHKPAPPHVLPARHRMSPLESLRRFQIDCGDLEQPETPLSAAVIPPAPLEPKFAMVSFGDTVPVLPPPEATLIAENTVPPLINVPTTPIVTTAAPIVTPEPGTLLLVLSGLGGIFYLSKRREREEAATAV